MNDYELMHKREWMNYQTDDQMRDYVNKQFN